MEPLLAADRGELGQRLSNKQELEKIHAASSTLASVNREQMTQLVSRQVAEILTMMFAEAPGPLVQTLASETAGYEGLFGILFDELTVA